MLEQHERTAHVLSVLVPTALARSRRIGPPSANGHGCRNQRVELAPELKLEESVEVVHMY
jgi:hypothetical protein